MKKIIVVLLVSILVSSCVTKPYKSKVLSDKLDSLTEVLNRDAVSLDDITPMPWREKFSDPILQGYIEKALQNNKSLVTARLTTLSTYAGLRKARAAYAPQLNATLSTEGEALTDNDFRGDIPLLGAASWELDIWGKLTANKRAQKAALLADINNMQAIQSQIVSQTAQAYYRLVAYDIQKEIVLKTIADRVSYYDTVKIMKKSGRVNEVAVQQAYATLAETRSKLPQLELAVSITENVLAELLGEQSFKMERTNKFDYGMIKKMEYIPAGALRNRPDVRAAEQNYRKSYELWNVAKAAMYPSLNLSATGGFADLLHTRIGILNSFAALTAPIWNGRALRTAKEKEEYSKKKSEVAFEQTVLKAGYEVSNAYNSQVKQYEIAGHMRTIFETYSKSYDYSYQLFLSGYATYYEVLLAQEGVYDSEILYIESMYDYICAQIDLYRSLGGGADDAMVDKQASEWAKQQTKEYRRNN